MDIHFNNIKDLPYSTIYFKLLSQLTECPIINSERYKTIIQNIPDNHHIFVYQIDNIPIGIITILIEQKLIHDGKCVGHIEDVVIDKNYNNKGIGSLMINNTISFAKENNCYKILLNCNENIKEFYKKNGLTEKNIAMCKYIN